MFFDPFESSNLVSDAIVAVCNAVIQCEETKCTKTNKSIGTDFDTKV